jgi:hypothetical protein
MTARYDKRLKKNNNPAHSSVVGELPIQGEMKSFPPLGSRSSMPAESKSNYSKVVEDIGCCGGQFLSMSSAVTSLSHYHIHSD